MLKISANSLMLLRTLSLHLSPKIILQGANSYGQLSLGHQEDQLLPRAITPQVQKIKFVTGGGGHTLVVTEEGQLWSCGSNNKGQLGLGSTEDVLTLTLVTDLQNVTMAAGGWDFSLAVTASGELYSWGSNSFMQLGDSSLPVKTTRPCLWRFDHGLLNTGFEIGQLTFLVECMHKIHRRHAVKLVCCIEHKISTGNGEKVVSVSAGLRHSVALTTAGNVYCWGHGKKGQCGFVGDTTPVSQVSKPTKVTFPVGCGHIVQIAAGSYHTVALTESGNLFSWGCNKYGQSTQDPRTISQVNVPYHLGATLFTGRVAEVRSGWTHLIAKTDDRHIFTWGRADYCQLGRPHDFSYDHIPAPISDVVKHAKLIECGSEHTLAVTEDGSLYSWGWNEHGICGTGDETNVPQPQWVQAVESNVINIGCGAGHSYVITDSQNIEMDEKG